MLPASLFVSVLYAVQSIRLLDNNAVTNGSSLYHLLFMLRIAGCLLRMELLYQITAAIAIKAIKDSLFEDSLLRNHTDCMKNTNVVL